MTSDTIPGPVPIPVSLEFLGHSFSKELPGQIKDYIFSPLNGISSNAQLISHMMKDGLIDNLNLDFKTSGSSIAHFSENQNVLFEINKGERGKGKFSEVKFYPSYVSLVYGNNSKCCMGYFTNCCMVQSHETVIFQIQTSCIHTSFSSFR